MRLQLPSFHSSSGRSAPTTVGLLARGPVATALARRLLAAPDHEWAPLRGVASATSPTPGAGVIVVLGEAAALPWVDGLTYLRRSADPRLIVPTTQDLDVPDTALLEALQRAHPGLAPPVVVLSGLVVSVADARPLHRARLSAWLSARLEAHP